MKGKTIDKKRIIKTLMLIMGFVLTIVLTASVTLAWFYDSDWANKSVTMAGSVGIEMRDDSGNLTSGAGNFHLMIDGKKAYPGQSIEIEASVFNNGGTSIENHFTGKTYDKAGGENKYDDDDIKAAGTGASANIDGDEVGSPAYIRARFVVYTNIGADAAPTAPTKPENYDTDATAKATYDTAKAKYDRLVEEYQDNLKFNAACLYKAMLDMITDRNTKQSDYDWVFWQNDSAKMPIKEGTTTKNYFEGVVNDTATDDGGYFYLCKNDSNILMPLNVGDAAAFLWDGTFIIPWQLTNMSADKTIFVALEFQAVQTYIPLINASGEISTAFPNQLDANKCIIQDRSVQTVFNSSRFTNMSTLCTLNGYDYSSPTAAAAGFVKASLPADDDAAYAHGTVVENGVAYTAGGSGGGGAGE